MTVAAFPQSVLRSAGLGGVLAALVAFAAAAPAAPAAHEKVILESWDWVTKQREVGRKFTGTPGVMLILGDSNSYANQATRWARQGKGHSPEEKAVLQWTHCGKRDKTDGWWLTSVDVPENRSHTSASGVRADQYIRGGKGGMPPLAEIIHKYNPQVAFVALGTNDVKAGRGPAAYAKDIGAIVAALYANGTMAIVLTVTPFPQKQPLVNEYNRELLRLGAEKRFALCDVYGAFLERRPGTSWDGTLTRPGNVHFTHKASAGPPTDENLNNCGYLLRCVAMVRKLVELKKHAVDGLPHPRFKGGRVSARAGRAEGAGVSAARPREKPQRTASRARPRPKRSRPQAVKPLSDERKARSLLSLAENYLRAGFAKQAKAKLMRVIATYPETQAARTAKGRLAQLGGNGAD